MVYLLVKRYVSDAITNLGVGFRIASQFIGEGFISPGAPVACTASNSIWCVSVPTLSPCVGVMLVGTFPALVCLLRGTQIARLLFACLLVFFLVEVVVDVVLLALWCKWLR